MHPVRWAAACLVLVLAACTSASPTPSPVGPTPTPVPTPTLTPAPTAAPAAADFTFEVIPAEMPVEVRAAIPGQRICFLVVVKDAGTAQAAVTIGASAKGAAIEEIRPAQLLPGEVGEVWVVPEPASAETIDEVTFTAARGGVTRTIVRSIKIMPMIDERAKDARPYFERWVAWLAKAHPELGLTAQTKWEPVFVSTLLVVSHYSYYSPEWELAISWHVMIAPNDWTTMYLRHRGTETKPSIAFKIDSVSGGTAPHVPAAIDWPDLVR